MQSEIVKWELVSREVSVAACAWDLQQLLFWLLCEIKIAPASKLDNHLFISFISISHTWQLWSHIGSVRPSHEHILACCIYTREKQDEKLFEPTQQSQGMLYQHNWTSSHEIAKQYWHLNYKSKWKSYVM